MSEPKFSFVGTFTGKHYHFLDPKPDQICIEDIARALSMQCRFSGHVKRFYSVAEHSVLLAEYVISQTRDLGQAYSALLHDASEAYLTDVPRPIKSYLGGYDQIEKKAEKAIQDKFSCAPPSEFVRYVDTHIVGAEAAALFLERPSWCSDFDPIDIQPCCWGPEEAEQRFLHAFLLLERWREDDIRLRSSSISGHSD